MDLTPYLQLMVDKGASDLFLSVGARPNIKIEGNTIPIGKTPLDPQDVSALAYSVLDPAQQRDFEAALELNMGFSVDGVGRFRANLYRARGEVAMVIRHIKDKVASTAELGLPGVLKTLILEKHGLLLVVGATGSGKSTTLAALLDYRNTNKAGHILTIEDPIEFVHPHKKAVVDQREVGIDTHSYGEALKNALREAPDVILIGEIRDQETMQHALHFSETGHLCISTLHAANANQTLERIINFFPEEARDRALQDLSLHLKAIVSQRLIRGVDGKRLAAVEVLMNSPTVADYIEHAKISELKQFMERDTVDGMQTFDQDVYELFKSGRISAREAVRNADSAHNVRMRIEFEHPGTFSNISDEDLALGEN